jgi:hypothetical protein
VTVGLYRSVAVIFVEFPVDTRFHVGVAFWRWPLKCGGRVEDAAALLGLSRKGLYLTSAGGWV